jgi:hypothetical protein
VLVELFEKNSIDGVSSEEELSSSSSLLYRVLKKKLIENDFKQNAPYDNFDIDIYKARISI